MKKTNTQMENRCVESFLMQAPNAETKSVFLCFVVYSF